MTRASHLQITFDTADMGPLKRRPMTEGQFREALKGILVAGSEFGGEEFASLAAAAEAIDKVGADSSWLGSFTTIADQNHDENLVPAGLECPRCGQDQMDSIAAQDDGDFRCDCGALYSGDTEHGGRPAWYQTAEHLSSRRYYVPSRNVYVSVPD